MLASVAIFFGVASLVSVARLSYWEEKRIFFHVLPYLLVAIYIGLVSWEWQRFDWLGVAISLGLIGFLHIVSFFADSMKE